MSGKGRKSRTRRAQRRLEAARREYTLARSFGKPEEVTKAAMVLLRWRVR